MKVFVLPCTQHINRCWCWSQLETDRACPMCDFRKLRRVSYLHGTASFDQDWISTGPRHLKKKKATAVTSEHNCFTRLQKGTQNARLWKHTGHTEGAEKGRCSLLKWQKRICVHKFKENELKRNLQIRNGNYLKCQKETQSQMKGTKGQMGAVLRWEKNDCIQMKLLIQDPQQAPWPRSEQMLLAGRGQVGGTVVLDF